MLARFGERWVFHLDDPAEAPALGVAAGRVPAVIPGRLVVASSGLDAHLALLDPDQLGGDGGPLPIGVLPQVVPVAALGRVAPGVDPARGQAVRLVVGVDYISLSTAVLDVPHGEHVMLVGPGRSGRSSALLTLIAAWRAQRPDDAIRVVCPTRTSPLVERYRAAASIGEVTDLDAARLIVVDDCERVDDPDGRLTRLMAHRTGEVTVLAAGRADALRAAYGHWTAVCRRSRLGLVMAAGGELDGDLLGVTLPRRTPIPPRPGLAWLVDGSGPKLIQLALDTPIS